MDQPDGIQRVTSRLRKVDTASKNVSTRIVWQKEDHLGAHEKVDFEDMRDQLEFLKALPKEQLNNSLKDKKRIALEKLLPHEVQRIATSQGWSAERSQRKTYSHCCWSWLPPGPMGVLNRCISFCERMCTPREHKGPRRRKLSEDKANSADKSEDNLDWMNKFFARTWPYWKIAIERKLDEAVTPILKGLMPLQCLKNRVGWESPMNLGDGPPLIGPLRLLEKHSSDGIETIVMRIGVKWESDCDLRLNAGLFRIGLTKLRIRGNFRMELGPCLDELPVVGGVLMGFLNPPRIEFEFAIGHAQHPFIARTVIGAIEQAIANSLVLPNRIVCPIADPDQLKQHRKYQGLVEGWSSAQAKGVLRVTVIEAKNIKASDSCFFHRQTSDPYVELKLGTEKWKSMTVHGTCAPQWNMEKNPMGCSHDFMVFDLDQQLCIRMFNKDRFRLGSDDFLHLARPITVRDAIKQDQKWLKLHDVDDADEEEPHTEDEDASDHQGARILLGFEWLKLNPDADEIKRASQQGGFWSSVAHMVITVNEVTMPKEFVKQTMKKEKREEVKEKFEVGMKVQGLPLQHDPTHHARDKDWLTGEIRRLPTPDQPDQKHPSAYKLALEDAGEETEMYCRKVRHIDSAEERKAQVAIRAKYGKDTRMTPMASPLSASPDRQAFEIAEKQRFAEIIANCYTELHFKEKEIHRVTGLGSRRIDRVIRRIEGKKRRERNLLKVDECLPEHLVTIGIANRMNFNVSLEGSDKMRQMQKAASSFQDCCSCFKSDAAGKMLQHLAHHGKLHLTVVDGTAKTLKEFKVDMADVIDRLNRPDQPEKKQDESRGPGEAPSSPHSPASPDVHEESSTPKSTSSRKKSVLTVPWKQAPDAKVARSAKIDIFVSPRVTRAEEKKGMQELRWDHGHHQAVFSQSFKDQNVDLSFTIHLWKLLHSRHVDSKIILKPGSAEMEDPDGDKGTYHGQMKNDLPHGKGKLVYHSDEATSPRGDDGGMSVFVGEFLHGKMDRGVCYNGKRPKFTMKHGLWLHNGKGQWTIDQEILRQFPMVTQDEAQRRRSYLRRAGTRSEVLGQYGRLLGSGPANHLQWMNDTLQRLWPFADKAIFKMLKEDVVPMINSSLPATLHRAIGDISFDEASTFGDPPLLSGIEVSWRKKVEDDDDEGESGWSFETGALEAGELSFQIVWQGNAHVNVRASMISLGVNSLEFSGNFVVRFRPFLRELPVIGGMVLSFFDNPVLKIDFGGLGNIADAPMISGIVRNQIRKQIASRLVLPNAICVGLASQEQLRRKAEEDGTEPQLCLNSTKPFGILRARLLKARNLYAADFHLLTKATSDPYVVAALADEHHTFSTIFGTCNPDWPEDQFHYFMVYDAQQRIFLDVYDKDHLKSDDFLGSAQPLRVEEIFAREKNGANVGDLAQVVRDIPLSSIQDCSLADGDKGEDRGTVTMRFDWFTCQTHGQLSDMSCISVTCDQVNLPDDWTEVGLRMKMGDLVKSSPVLKAKEPPDETANNPMFNRLGKMAQQMQQSGLSEQTMSKALDWDIADVKSLAAGSTSVQAIEKARNERFANKSEEDLMAMSDAVRRATPLKFQGIVNGKATDPSRQRQVLLGSRLYVTATREAMETGELTISLVGNADRVLAEVSLNIKELTGRKDGEELPQLMAATFKVDLGEADRPPPPKEGGSPKTPKKKTSFEMDSSPAAASSSDTPAVAKREFSTPASAIDKEQASQKFATVQVEFLQLSRSSFDGTEVEVDEEEAPPISFGSAPIRGPSSLPLPASSPEPPPRTAPSPAPPAPAAPATSTRALGAEDPALGSYAERRLLFEAAAAGGTSQAGLRGRWGFSCARRRK